MSKPKLHILKCTLVIVMGLIVMAIFVTSTSYAQLAVAITLYPVLAYFALKVFSRKTQPQLQQKTVLVTAPVAAATVAGSVPLSGGSFSQGSDILDIDKRTFLKLVGATGVFFFISSLLGKWAGALPFGKVMQTTRETSDDVSQIDTGGTPSISAGYTITEIDDGAITYYGFTNKNGSWLMMREDTATSSFRYAKGESSFPKNWQNRSTLKYDYYYNLQ